MDIKLRARLSAYSKIESIKGMSDNNLPHPDAAAEGHVLGVGSNGQYTLIRRVTQEDMSEKWGQAQAPEYTPKEWIDTLFDTPAEKSDVLDKESIDKLFDDNSTEDVVEFNESSITDSYYEEQQTAGISKVSYAAIDSLFNE